MGVGEAMSAGGGASTGGREASLSAPEPLTLEQIDAQLRELLALRHMTAGAAASPVSKELAAGWRPDPSGRYQYRYWDGGMWTSWVSSEGEVSSDSTASSTSALAGSAPPSAASSTPRAAAAHPAPASVHPAAKVLPPPVGRAPSAGARAAEPAKNALPPRRRWAVPDLSRLLLGAGVALVVAGLGGLTTYLWSSLGDLGRLVVLAAGFAAQTAAALRIRRRLPAAAEAVGATAAATLLFTVGATLGRPGGEVVLGAGLAVSGLALLVPARFRSWTVGGHAGVSVGVLIALQELSPFAAIFVAVLLFALRHALPLAPRLGRPEGVGLYEHWLAVPAYLLVAYALAELSERLDPSALAAGGAPLPVLGGVAAAAAVSAAAMLFSARTALERNLGYTLAALVAVVAVGSSFIIWLDLPASEGVSLSPGLADSLLPAALLALLPLYALAVLAAGGAGKLSGRPSHERTAASYTLAVSAPLTLRLLLESGGLGSLLLYAALAVAALPVLGRRLRPAGLYAAFALAAVAGAVASTEALPAYPRLAVAAAALWCLAPALSKDLEVYIIHFAVSAGLVGVLDLLYDTTGLSGWEYQPEAVGGLLAASLTLALVRTGRFSPAAATTTPLFVKDRRLLPVVAVLASPLASTLSEPAFLALSSSAQVRLTLVLVVLVGCVAAALGDRDGSLTAFRTAAVAVAAALMVSRMADESAAVQTAAFLMAGAVAVAVAVARRWPALLPVGWVFWAVAVLVAAPGMPTEVYTVGLAAVAAVLALLARLSGRRGSLDFLPASSLALLPSAFISSGDVLRLELSGGDLLRLALVLVAASAALAVGVDRRLAALVYPALAALAVVSATLMVHVPGYLYNWYGALLAGALLILLGMRFEALKNASVRASERAGRFLRALR